MVITTTEFESAIEFAFLRGVTNSLTHILTPLETMQRIRRAQTEAYNIIQKEREPKKEENHAHQRN